MNILKINIVGLALLTLLMGGTAVAQKPKNVIFIVGDGMGTAQVYSSIVAKGEGSQFLRFPVTGFSRTYCLDRYTTDSGAGGTALMTGHKVNYHAIALSPEGVEWPSFLKVAHDELGKKTGIVVTCSPLDATPASTYGHVPERSQWDTLSMQMAQCCHDVIIGGDRKSFQPKHRKDGKAPIDTLERRGYTMVYSQDDLYAQDASRLCALLTDDWDAGNAEKRNNWLAPSAEKAINILNRNEQGFVMMIEGSQIDWACHANNFDAMLMELNEFELMLAKVLDFAEKDGNTLVVVTADHETGGLTLNKGDIDAHETTEHHYTTTNHTGVMVPVFAYGPGAERFAGIQQNTDFFNKILDLLR
ncbi:MAG: alkaline phosphatase [Bacteroidales bacterium]|nr:alkaline phosphatase [Bacteroidales bacterium]